MYSLIDQYLCQWKILSRQCGFIPDKCNIKMHTYTPYKSFRKRYDCYKKLQKQWKKRASASISGLTPVEEATTEKHQNSMIALVNVIYSFVHTPQYKNKYNAYI